MKFMEWLRVSYYTIGSLTSTVLYAFIIIYLFVWGRTIQSRYLGGFFTGMFILALGTTLRHSIYAPWGAYFNSQFTNLGLFHIVPLIQYAYHFPENIHQRESKILFIISTLILLSGYLLYINQIWGRTAYYNFPLHIYTFGGGSIPILPTILLGFYLWVGGIFIRKIWYFSTYQGRFSAWLTPIKPITPLKTVKFLSGYILIMFVKILNSQDEKAKPLKIAIVNVLFIIVAVIINLIAQFGLISKELNFTFFTIIILLGLHTIFLIHLTYVHETTSFIVKLTSVFLVTLLVILGLIGSFTLSFANTQFDNERLAEVMHVKTIIDQKANLNIAEIIPNIAYVVAYPSSQNSNSFLPSSIFNRSPLPFNTSREEDTTLVANDRPGAIRQYRQYNQNQYLYYQFIENEILYEVGYNLALYRAYIHQIASPLLIILGFSILVIVGGVPYFFRTNLVSPLNNLLAGVKEVNEGNLKIQVPIKTDDEIGFLTRSFNAMTTSIEGAIKTREQLLAIRQELEIAHQIQQKLLPAPDPGWRNPSLQCYTIPAKEVGGDFYAYQAFDSQHIALAIGDVVGKGMPAALLMAVSLASLYTLMDSQLPPKDLLKQLNKSLIHHTRNTQQNCAMCYAMLKQNILWVANAGCVNPLVRHTDGRVTWIDAIGLPLGITASTFDYLEVSLTLTTGDLVIFTTDGVIEAHNPDHQIFGFDGLEQAVASAPNGDVQTMLNHLKTRIASFVKGAKQQDDLTIVVLQM